MSIRNTRDIEELKQRIEEIEKRFNALELTTIGSPAIVKDIIYSMAPRQKRKYTRKVAREINA